MGSGFEWDFDSIVAILSVAIPLTTFVWEFVVVRRKRLGFRVQMDTLAMDTAHAPHAGVLARMHQNGTELAEPSFVLVRIENAGWMEIVEGDYLTPQHDKTGIRVRFRGRRVVGMAVTELSQDELRDFFIRQVDGDVREAEGFEITDEGDVGVINLPKVKLNTGAHYKVLAVLERRSGNPGDPFLPPVFRADVSRRHQRGFGWVARLKMARTEGHTFASRPAKVGIVLLAAAVLTQATLVLFWREETPPLDCVGGTLHLHGSTAFEPAVRKAAERYVQLCGGKGARIPLPDGTFQGSTEGIGALERAAELVRRPGRSVRLGDQITFTDGRADARHVGLSPRPVVHSVFALAANANLDVHGLSRRQIRDIYSGRAKNWSDVGGPPIPIHLIGRPSGSGTRAALVGRVLENKEVPGPTVNDCAALKDDEYGRCEVGGTQALLREVAKFRGALGYSEVYSVNQVDGVKPVPIDSAPASLAGVQDGKYPYWQVEYAYTYGELPAGSIAAAFLRYLTDQGGKDILREFGNRPCSETEYPLECTPT